MSELANLNKLLPPGVKAVEVNGNIRFTVRTSVKGKRESLGTFTDQKAAIKALYEYKIKKSYTVAADAIADEVTSIVASKQEKLQEAIKQEERNTPLAESVEVLRNYIDMNGPHLLDDGNSAMNIPMDDGTIKHVSKEVVAIIYSEVWGMAPSGASKQISEL